MAATLEDYFQLRHSWFPGPKEGFEWLRNNDAPTLAAFERGRFVRGYCFCTMTRPWAFT